MRKKRDGEAYHLPSGDLVVPHACKEQSHRTQRGGSQTSLLLCRERMDQ